jgi:hypothetical protein
MILAVAALLLHFPAVPQVLVAGGDSVSSIERPVSTDSKSADEPISDSNGAPATPELNAALAADLTDVGPLEPGRLTPTPVSAAVVASGSPSSPAPVIVSAPTDLDAKERARRNKRIWLALSAAGHGSATFDAWTTRRVISSGAGYEMDPLLRPFAGNASIYVAIQAGPALLEYFGHRMMNSHRTWERRTWWVPQTLGAAMNLASGVHNLGVH